MAPAPDQNLGFGAAFQVRLQLRTRDNDLVESADSRSRLPSRWAGVEAKLPPALDQLAGPADGVVELPLDLAWSGDRTSSLSWVCTGVTVLMMSASPAVVGEADGAVF